MLGWQTGVAFGSFLAGTQIQGLIVLNYPGYIYERWHGTLLDIAILVLAVCFNTFFAQQLHIIEGTVMVLHLVGFLAILLPVWILSDKSTSAEVWTSFNDPGWDSIGLSSLIGIVASVAPLLGADAAGEWNESCLLD